MAIAKDRYPPIADPRRFWLPLTVRNHPLATARVPDEDQLFLRPAKPPRYDERNTTSAQPELEHIAALRRERAKLAFVIS
jgi:hypothetical protein